jgi:hypothetical protein
MINYRYLELEDMDTWSLEFTEAVRHNRQLIISYQTERSRIERLNWDDLKIRFNPPKNPYKDEYLQLVTSLDEFLKGCSIVGYHCTRLLPEEIKIIKENGLILLSKELIQSKFNLALSSGYISTKQYETLIKSKNIKESLDNQHGHRTGMIWFCPNRSTLKDASDVYRLFRSWGGEAVYNGHEDEDGVDDIPILRSIGIPSIVKCAIPIINANQYHSSYGERFLSYYISDAIETLEPTAGFDMNIERNLFPNEVLEIIQFDNPVFLELTNFLSWREQYQIDRIIA